MPYDDPDATDPMTLQGMVLETEDEEATREMAECFIEEYSRSGFEPGRVMSMFQSPEYVGPHLAYRTLGERVIRELIAAWAPMWAARGTVRLEKDAGTGAVRLPVLPS